MKPVLAIKETGDARDDQKLLRRHGFKVSMSGKGNCHDNSAVESFCKSLKAELVWRHGWQTRREVGVTLFEYVNGFCNPRRKHSAPGRKSPAAFEQRAAWHHHLTGTEPVQVHFDGSSRPLRRVGSEPVDHYRRRRNSSKVGSPVTGRPTLAS